MRQIVLEDVGRLSDRRVPIPVPEAGEALVRIRRVGICGTDFHAFGGVQAFFTYPRVLGHEIACEVVQVPANERGICPRDRCAIEPYLSCGRCRACLFERPNCCENLRVLGVHVDGAMQAMFTIPVGLLHKSEKLSFDQLALVEPLGVGAHAVERSGLKKGEEALVIGAGPIGLAVIQFAVAAGAKVVAVEQSESRRAFAEQFGVAALAQAGGRLADVVFDATGSAAAMAASLKSVAPGGRLVFVGLTKEPVSIDDVWLHKNEVTLYASRNSCHQFPRIIQMIEQGKIDTRPWITNRLNLGDVPQLFAEIRRQPTTIKAMIEVSEADSDRE
jgi:2-desacetyl-2-hydroxyethyl bacteriochlorophyllide A dehydrogenase